MTTPTLLLWSLTSAALFTSICALFVALRSSARSQSKRLSELLAMQAAQAEQLENFTIALRNLRSRLNMQTYRARKSEKQADEAASGDDGREWVRKMNLKLATRGLKLPED